MPVSPFSPGDPESVENRWPQAAPPKTNSTALPKQTVPPIRNDSGIQVRMEQDKLFVGGKPFFFRAIRYTDTPVGTMVMDQTGGGGRFTDVVLRPAVTVADPSMTQKAQALADFASSMS